MPQLTLRFDGSGSALFNAAGRGSNTCSYFMESTCYAHIQGTKMVFQNSHNINPGFLQTVSAAHRDSLSAFSNACSGKYNTETLTRILRLYLTALVLNVAFLACVRANKDKAEPGERPGETLASSGRHTHSCPHRRPAFPTSPQLPTVRAKPLPAFRSTCYQNRTSLWQGPL